MNKEEQLADYFKRLETIMENPDDRVVQDQTRTLIRDEIQPLKGEEGVWIKAHFINSKLLAEVIEDRIGWLLAEYDSPGQFTKSGFGGK